MNASDLMLDSAQLYGGLVVLRKTPFVLRFVREWLAWVTAEGGLVTDTLDVSRQHRGFVEHRHDQSVLSLLAKRYGLKSFPMPTRAHDVRDIWAWEAGYCHKGFTWPLPSQRHWTYMGYITHYLEMGHQYKSMEHCRTVQPVGAPVPLPDYLESTAVLRQLQLDKRIDLRRRLERWGPHRERPRLLSPRPVEMLPYSRKHHGNLRPSKQCAENTTFGGFTFEGVPHVWTHGGCRGVFRCDNAIKLWCGRTGRAGRVELTICTCNALNALPSVRHWNDGSLEIS
jgi:hypothetical protein